MATYNYLKKPEIITIILNGGSGPSECQITVGDIKRVVYFAP